MKTNPSKFQSIVAIFALVFALGFSNVPANASEPTCQEAKRWRANYKEAFYEHWWIGAYDQIVLLMTYLSTERDVQCMGSDGSSQTSAELRLEILTETSNFYNAIPGAWDIARTRASQLANSSPAISYPFSSITDGGGTVNQSIPAYRYTSPEGEFIVVRLESLTEDITVVQSIEDAIGIDTSYSSIQIVDFGADQYQGISSDQLRDTEYFWQQDLQLDEADLEILLNEGLIEDQLLQPDQIQ